MCANFLKCSLLAHKRIDQRLWAVLALGSLAFEPIQKQDEQGGSTSTPWQTECGVMGDGPELDTLRRAKADPKKEIQQQDEKTDSLSSLISFSKYIRNFVVVVVVVVL